MNGLDPHEAARLQRFIDLLLFPALDTRQQRADTAKGMARAMLASRVKWAALDLAFLRWAACGYADRKADYVRLDGLLQHAIESTR